jgi:sulfite dehydrogenase (cytochrome) subunit B
MRALLILPALTLAIALPAAAADYPLPPENTTLANAPDVDIVRANCTVCHSADYITTQPRSYPNPEAVWSAEVNKMRKTYGAQVDDSVVPQIVGYLTKAYGR